MADITLSYTSARELTRAVRARELSPVEVIANSLERIDGVSRSLNCFCAVYADEALALAAAAERAVLRREPVGPLHGLPVAVKDLTPIEGKRTSMGSHAYEDWVPERTAVVVARLLEAGAIVVGKTTTPEFGYSTFTNSPKWGVTRNPWDPTRSPGGSSGGSAVAVATGCVPLAEGTDMGGSVRIPAAWTGTVGLKPSHGRIPLEFLPMQVDTIQHVGPLARTIDDAWLFLASVQGPSDADLTSFVPALDLAGEFDRTLDGLRLALDVDLGDYAIDPDIDGATRAAANALAGAGAIVEEIDIGWTRELADAWLTHWCVYLAASFGHLIATHADRMDPALLALLERGFEVGAVEFKRLELVRSRAWKELAAVFDRYDALLCPTMSQTARPVDDDEAAYLASFADGLYHGLELTSQFNLFGQCPALSVPSGWSSEGLPIGLQIVAHPYRDDVAMQIGAALELVRPWRSRRPPEEFLGGLSPD